MQTGRIDVNGLAETLVFIAIIAFYRVFTDCFTRNIMLTPLPYVPLKHMGSIPSGMWVSDHILSFCITVLTGPGANGTNLPSSIVLVV